jgi:hypothetical protein
MSSFPKILFNISTNDPRSSLTSHRLVPKPIRLRRSLVGWLQSIRPGRKQAGIFFALNSSIVLEDAIPRERRRETRSYHRC